MNTKALPPIRVICDHTNTLRSNKVASNHQFVTEWSAEKFIADGEKIHTDVAHYITQVIETKKHPEAAYKSCMGILHFARKVGNDRLTNACREYTGSGCTVIRKLKTFWPEN